MKIRNGFVSNSSSSSFIVISNQGNNYNVTLYTAGTLVVGQIGTTEFGWEHTTYNTVYDRINFAYIQTECGKDYNRLKMLEDVLKNNIVGLVKIVWNISDEYNCVDGKVWGYIDHQSARCEGQNMEMFESMESLTNFIFGMNSYIQGGNDNS